MILVISHDACEPFVGFDAPDFDGLADAEVPIPDDRRAVMTDVNGPTFSREIFPTLHGGEDTKAQIQKDSFTAAKIFFSRSARLRDQLGKQNCRTLCQTTPPLKNGIDLNSTSRNQRQL